MSMLEQIVLAGHCMLRTVRLILRPGLWAPWVILGTVQLAVVGALWWFAHPALSWLLAPWLEKAAGPQVLHYPNLFRVLPGLAGRADLVVGAVLGSFATGAATILFATRFARRPVSVGQGLGRALGRMVDLLLANLPLTLLLVAMSFGIELVMADRPSGGMLRKAVQVGSLAAAVVFQAFFLYVNPLVMLDGRGWLSALAELPRTAARGAWAALLLSALSVAALLPVQQVLERTDRLVDFGKPELVGWALVLQILLVLAVSFLVTGSGTLVYQSALAPGRHEEGA